jgi:hypothetical protein
MQRLVVRLVSGCCLGAVRLVPCLLSGCWPTAVRGWCLAGAVSGWRPAAARMITEC